MKTSANNRDAQGDSLMRKPATRHIFITGASSGIGEALARHYAAPGITLGLAARRVDKLEDVQRACEDRGAVVMVYAVDVSDRVAMQGAATGFTAATGGADLVIANAGTSMGGHMRHVYHDAGALQRVIEVNLCGVIHTIAPFLQDALENKRPMHLAAVGSVAGFRGLPGGSYSASKAGVKTMMDSWRLVYRGTGLRFTTLCPGYVESEMTGRDAFAPKRMLPAAKGAAMVARALQRGVKTYVFPPRYLPATWLLPFLPDALLRLGIQGRMQD
jgi:NAD(P)-dependent dehydrogenase (short-subunit alcohol dehydrogenase family)